MEVCFWEFRCTGKQNMETLDFLMEGRAQRWWSSASAPIIAVRGVVTWADFCTAFQKLYFPPALRQAKASELLSLRQGLMSIDEYQQKFFELLPYCPKISDSTEAKYSLFLRGLNPKIHDRVVVGNDMNYEGLVSQCHQVEDSIRRNRSFLSSRPTSSLGPRTQSFKKSGSFSSAGSGETRQSSKKKLQFDHCERDHPTENCKAAAGACFICGSVDHFKRDCPKHGGQSGQASRMGY
ncbi:uncharacterized protein [Henckelia pumila]|uniref:uncharacterized protein n=1 Tax=Henckelia pumila TaxID=405737 RepID=UPI003C6E146F